VPGEIAECHCGMSRRAADAQAAEEKRKAAPAFPMMDFVGGLAVLAGVFYLGFSLQRAREEARPSAGAPLVRPPDALPTAAPPGPPRLPVTRAEPSAADSLREAMPVPTLPSPTPAPSEAVPPSPMVAAASPSPTPSPAAAAKPERSDTDVRREQAEQRLEQTLARLQGEMTRLSANTREFQSICLGTRGEASSCARLFNDIATAAETVDRELQQTEEDARHAAVVPGVLRDLRQRHGLEESSWTEMQGTVRRLEAQYHGKQ
jgi:hypothetical protein